MGTALDITPRREAVALPVGRRSDALSALIIAFYGAVVFAPIYLAAWAGPGWSTIACWLWFGILGHGFHQILHECAHKLAFRVGRRNEILARWMVAPLYFADFEAFRRRHWRHHRELGGEGDPKYTYRISIRGTGFLQLMVSMLTLVGAARKGLLQVSGRSEATRESTRQALVAMALVQPIFALTILLAAYLGHSRDWQATLWSAGVAYLLVYFYGVAGLTVWVTTLRAIAEHGRSGADVNVVGAAALRNFSHQPLDRLLFGAYGLADHATHHLHPGVPSYQLPELTQRLAAQDATLAPVGTHIDVLVRLVRSRPEASRPRLQQPEPRLQ